MEWISQSPEETQAIAAELLSRFPEVKVICLEGELGSGKTCFTKGLGRALNIPEKNIKSPTFVTVLQHKGEGQLLHFDFYRHDESLPLDPEWWNEWLTRSDALIVIEWGSRIQAHLPQHRLEIRFESLKGDQRRLILKKYP